MLAGDLRNARSAQLGGPNAASGPCIGRAHARAGRAATVRKRRAA